MLLAPARPAFNQSTILTLPRGGFEVFPKPSELPLQSTRIVNFLARANLIKERRKLLGSHLFHSRVE